MMEDIRELWKTEEVLIGLDRCGGEATTTEIRQNCSLETSDQVRYQLKSNLAPEGYIGLEQPEPDGGRPRAKVATLTERGSDLVKEIREARDGDGTVESTLGTLSSQVEELSSRLTHLEDRIDSVEAQDSQKTPSSVTSAEIEAAEWGALDEDALDIIARLRGTVRAYQKYLTDKVGHSDELRDLINNEVKNVYEEMGISGK